jgi:hypothetical protein
MKFFQFFVITLVLFISVMTINIFRFDYNLSDGFWRTLMTPFEGTVWAPHFSEKGFSQIKPHMNKQRVVELIGEPLRKECDNQDCLWIYTWQDSGTADFDQRWVQLDLSGHVTQVRKSFFID